MGSGQCYAKGPAGRRNGELSPILLVEDEVFIRIASAEWLRDAGYTVIEAADAAEALDMLGSGQPLALLATDITMPGPFDGLALAARAKSGWPELPVLLLSAHLPADPMDHADGALSKPFGPMELVALIEKMIGAPWQTRNHANGANKAC